MISSGHGRMLQRLALMIGGEAMQSGFHFALNIVLIHVLSAYAYGVFAMVMVIGGIGLSYIRSLTAVPASIWIAKSTTRAERLVHDVTFGSAATAFVLVMAVVTSSFIYLWAGTSAIAAGCFVGLWSLRSHLRTAFFARKQQVLVSLSDFSFTVSGACLAALAVWASEDQLRAVILSLAAANGVGILVLLVLARQPVRVSFRPTLRRRYARLWPQLRWSAVSCTTTNLQGQCVALLVGGIAGPAAYAPIAAVIVLFAPLRIIASAFVNMMQPELSALLAKREAMKVWSLAKIWSIILGFGSLVYAAGMFAVLPMIKSDVLANTSVEVIWIFAWATYAFTLLYMMPRIVLEVFGDFRIIAVITSVAACVGLALIAFILKVASPPWALVGAAASEAVVLGGSWLYARRHIRALALAGGHRPFIRKNEGNAVRKAAKARKK